MAIKKVDPASVNLTVEKAVWINRVAKVTKGAKRFNFAALVVVGDKAREVPLAITKAVEDAKKQLIEVPLRKTTIPHEVIGYFSASKVLLRPASEGTGVIAGGSVRAVLEAAGIRDILTKSLGSRNPINQARATLAALLDLRQPEDVAKTRGRPIEQIAGVRR